MSAARSITSDAALPDLSRGLRLRATRAPAAESALVSRFAGAAVLPHGATWPRWDSSALHQRSLAFVREQAARCSDASRQFWADEAQRYQALIRDNPRPLAFLALLRLDDVSAHAAALDLPAQGALLVFADLAGAADSYRAEARGSCQVIYVPDEDDLIVVDDPAAYLAATAPATLSFELDDPLDASLAPLHQLRGAPHELTRGLFEQCAQASHGDADDWRLLLQLDSDPDGPGWAWGDGGRLYVCVHRDDLAARRFDRAWCVEQG